MRIVIPGEPIAKARHRSFMRNGHIATYDKQQAAVAAFRYLLISEMLKNGYEIINGPVKVDIIFQMDA